MKIRKDGISTIELANTLLSILAWVLPNVHWLGKILISVILFGLVALLNQIPEGFELYPKNKKRLAIFLLTPFVLSIGMYFLAYNCYPSSQQPLLEKVVGYMPSPILLGTIYAIFVALPLQEFGFITKYSFTNSKDINKIFYIFMAIMLAIPTATMITGLLTYFGLQSIDFRVAATMSTGAFGPIVYAIGGENCQWLRGFQTNIVLFGITIMFFFLGKRLGLKQAG